MNEVFAAAVELQTFCQEQGWLFCFIGGIAVQRWSEPRFTDDVDITLLTKLGEEEKFIDSLIHRFIPRRNDALEFALRNRVLVLETRTGVGLDIALGAFPFEGRTVKRASVFRFPPGQSLITCSAEDLIIHKCFASRDKDWLDVDGILARQAGKLDLALIRRELPPLLALKEQPENLRRLEQKISRHNQPFKLIKPTRSRKKRR
jgi:hypothetical protein